MDATSSKDLTGRRLISLNLGHGFADPLQTFGPDFEPAALRAVNVHDQQQNGADK
jgi:hypothetical protein